jgi:hypothetical protein
MPTGPTCAEALYGTGEGGEPKARQARFELSEGSGASLGGEPGRDVFQGFVQ